MGAQPHLGELASHLGSVQATETPQERVNFQTRRTDLIMQKRGVNPHGLTPRGLKNAGVPHRHGECRCFGRHTPISAS